jgi:guanosine-diphosphatase
MYHEKPAMAQRSRLFKAGIIIAAAFLFLLYLVPSRPSVANIISGEWL